MAEVCYQAFILLNSEQMRIVIFKKNIFTREAELQRHAFIIAFGSKKNDILANRKILSLQKYLSI